MIKELAGKPYIDHTHQTDSQINKMMDYLSNKELTGKTILDVGQRSPMTDKMQNEFGVIIYNTSGDLDIDFLVPPKKYDVIIYSHTIEHQFNPLHTLINLKESLAKNGKLYIATVERGKFLWYPGHYHEIDDYRMRLLLKRAGFNVTEKVKYKVWRKWTDYLKGIRPILRLFLEYNVIYECKKK